MTERFRSNGFFGLVAVCLSLFVGIPSVCAQNQVSRAERQRVEQEINFANQLAELGFSDYAEETISQVLKDYPQIEDKVRLLQAKIYRQAGNLEGVKRLVDKMPRGKKERQLVLLQLAITHYQRGNPKKA